LFLTPRHWGRFHFRELYLNLERMRRASFFLLLIFTGFSTAMIASSFASSSISTLELAKKKKKKKDKKKKKKKAPKSNCDPKVLDRTSSDSLILKKYVTLYKDLGGVCYIKKLQDMGKIEKTDENKYTVYLGKSKSPEDRMAWTTFMYCPIGKPDGSVALVQASGDTVQYCTYKNERKEGNMYWLKPRYGVVAMFVFVNDEKPVEVVKDYDPNGTTPAEPEEPHNRTED
jgi:hypothetical protein